MEKTESSIALGDVGKRNGGGFLDNGGAGRLRGLCTRAITGRREPHRSLTERRVSPVYLREAGKEGGEYERRAVSGVIGCDSEFQSGGNRRIGNITLGRSVIREYAECMLVFNNTRLSGDFHLTFLNGRRNRIGSGRSGRRRVNHSAISRSTGWRTALRQAALREQRCRCNNCGDGSRAHRVLS